MLSRALSLATVMLLIGCFTAERAQAQNLEAGKSPSQIFAGTCSACHKSPRGLLKTVPPGSLSGFLRQHYTTSPDMANVLSSYLVSNGASDTRYVGAQPKGGKDSGSDGAKDGAREVRSDARFDAKPDARPSGPPDQLDRFGRRQRPATANQEAARPDARPDSEPRQAARRDAEGAPPGEPGRLGHNVRRLDAKRLARPVDAPEDAARPRVDGEVPAQAARERGPDGRRLSAKQKLSKRGRPGGEETPKDSSKDPFKEFFREEPKADTAKEEPSEPPKGDTAKVDPGKSDSGTSRSDSGKPEEGARPAGEGPSQSAKAEPGETPARPDQTLPVTPAPPPAVAASAPTPAPAGPPTPPISQ